MTTIIRADDIAPTPWKNGGGLARDLLTWPAAGPADWRLRISLADITRDGPFSAYPGVERWFAVVEGEGVELQFEGRVQAVRSHDAPLCFDGAAAPGCRLLAGATRDLNLMLRGVRGTLQRGLSFDEDWPQRGRFDIATRTLHWPLPAGPLRAEREQLWIGVQA
jgi:environmental stress-induced protein Ves